MKLTTTEKINAILSDVDYDKNGKYNALCHLSIKLENARRFADQYEVDEAIANLK